MCEGMILNCPRCGKLLAVTEETGDLVYVAGIVDECPSCGADLAFGDEGFVEVEDVRAE
jgi:hypothetical protein